MKNQRLGVAPERGVFLRRKGAPVFQMVMTYVYEFTQRVWVRFA
jgi:hypothetical protein